MRYRKLSPTGDFIFGQGSADYYINVPNAPGQAAFTRMKLLLGEWFLDTSDGMPWITQVLGPRTAKLRDVAIRNRILATPGINGITNYSSIVTARALAVRATLNTIYGTVTVQASL